jgi:hypothetical protein
MGLCSSSGYAIGLRFPVALARLAIAAEEGMIWKVGLAAWFAVLHDLVYEIKA